MPPRPLQRLVIDASVVRAAGDRKATHPTSIRCRDFLAAVQRLGYCVVLTPAIHEEWNRHRSGFARIWRVSMEARKKVVRVEAPVDKDLREAVAATAPTEKAREAVLKDLHLIEAALAADRSVISLDETIRALLHAAAASVGALRVVLWVNPDVPGEGAVAWLENKAKRDKHRMLGFKAAE